MLDLFQRKHIRSMIIGVGIMIFQQFNGINGISFYASETFALAGNSVFLSTMLDLFQRKHIRWMIIGVGIMIFQQFNGINEISFYASETFALAGESLAKIGTIAYACV